MCLIVRKNHRPYITKKDIVVYKTLRKILNTFGDFKHYAATCYSFSYHPNVLYTTEIKTSIDFSPADIYARDKYDKFYGNNNDDEDWRYDDKLRIKLKSIGPGFHSYGSKERALEAGNFSGEKIVKCIIPAGSTYYKDCSNLFVSNQIIVVEEAK